MENQKIESAKAKVLISSCGQWRRIYNADNIGRFGRIYHAVQYELTDERESSFSGDLGSIEFEWSEDSKHWECKPRLRGRDCLGFSEMGRRIMLQQSVMADMLTFSEYLLAGQLDADADQNDKARDYRRKQHKIERAAKLAANPDIGETVAGYVVTAAENAARDLAAQRGGAWGPAIFVYTEDREDRSANRVLKVILEGGRIRWDSFSIWRPMSNERVSRAYARDLISESAADGLRVSVHIPYRDSENESVTVHSPHTFANFTTEKFAKRARINLVSEYNRAAKK